MRIVSLIASATEIVHALGCADKLVGRSHECDHPESIRGLPCCTAPRFDVSGSSADIDRRVKDVLRDALSVYSVHADVLRELRPDVIVTQSQCDVCAVSERDVQAAVCDWLDNKPRIVSLAPDNLADVWGDVQRVADALGVPDTGRRVVAELTGRVQAIATRAAELERPRVACIEWIEPLMAAGNWVPELVELAGGENLLGVAGKHAPWTSWAELQAKDPDVIVVLPCGFDLPRTRQEMAALTQQPAWGDLRAVRTGRVYLTDGNQFFNRPGPRLVESLEILAEICHPDEFSFGHAAAGYFSRQ